LRQHNLIARPHRFVSLALGLQSLAFDPFRLDFGLDLLEGGYPPNGREPEAGVVFAGEEGLAKS
jgi:hypothetical protein